MTHLALSSIVKSYGAVAALNGAAIALRAGEVHALMGENGAGKSTLIRVLAGLEQADAGQIVLNAKPLPLASAAQEFAPGLRFLHQELQVVPGLSVAENMHLARPYPRRFGLVHWRALNAAAAAALTRLGVRHIAPDRRIGELGPGDQMLVRIAATLITDQGAAPWLYVLDEPTAALTGAEVEQLFRAIDSLKRAGAGILYVSHRIDEVLRICDRVTVLRDGAHVSTLATSETSQDDIIRDMTGRSYSALFPPRTAPLHDAVRLTVNCLQTAHLAKVDFDVKRGEIFGLAGLAGAGRNETLKAIIGATPRRAGKITLDGRTLGKTPADAWAQGIAYVPRERRSEGLMLLRALGETIVLPHLGRFSNLGFLDRKRSRAQVDALALQVRLKARDGEQSCAELSGGNQQKVLFARALVGKPKVLLLDEPTRGVDVAAKFDIYTLIRTLAASGVSIIIASSELSELIGLCDRIGMLSGGTLRRILPAAGLTEASLLAACYDSTGKDS